ncbi:MAG: deoxyribose-phosphate aldolase [Chloroflexi bacterium]|nr:deoxyribose-phosphate aldolase [Chloroflexota bacterium]
MSESKTERDWLKLARARLASIAHLPPAPPAPLTAEGLAALIDHTLLKPDATPEAIDRLCAEARAHRFASVCVNSRYVARCAAALGQTGVPVCAVVGFPLGACLTEVKVYEAERCLALGAREIDMVLAVGALKAGDYAAVRDDIAEVVAACHRAGAHCKVILETALLTEEEKVVACLLCLDAGADFVKTSTGFSSAGATVADVRLMRAVVGADAGVKAAGGIRTYADALAMVTAGANRIGASASVKIFAEACSASEAASA